MGKSKHKISNWQQYNQALVQRGSLTIWMDEQAIKQWHCRSTMAAEGGFPLRDTAIETALMLKGLFKLPLRALEGFINSLFQLMAVPLRSPDYSCISKRAKTVDIKYRVPSQGPVAHLVVMPPASRSMAKANGKFANTARRSDECGASSTWRWMPQPMRSSLPKSAWRRWRITRCYRRCSTPFDAR